MNPTASQSLLFFEDLAEPIACHARRRRRSPNRFHSLSAWKKLHGVRTHHSRGMAAEDDPWLAMAPGVTIDRIMAEAALIEEQGLIVTARTERRACARLAHNLALPYPE